MTKCRAAGAVYCRELPDTSIIAEKKYVYHDANETDASFMKIARFGEKTRRKHDFW